MTPRISAICVAIFAICIPAFADDSAAAIAAGGLVARRETRIVMAKEVLHISEKKIVVDYDFRNDSNENVTTEVAFPVPSYTDEIDQPAVPLESFSDFQLSIEGNLVRFKSEAKATIKGKDVTDVLIADKIDVATFGHYRQLNGGDALIEDLVRLPKAEQKRLRSLGLFADEGDPQQANWTVHLQYHWTQIFPAHSTVHIRHMYTPVLGYTQVIAPSIEAMLIARNRTTYPHTREMDDTKVLNGFCADRPFLKTLADSAQKRKSIARTEDQKSAAGTYYPNWVDFILTTANTWQRPIQDFTLIIDRPKTSDGEQTLVSFCSPGKVEKLDADHFQVHLTNFIPKAELHIGFFNVPTIKKHEPNPAK
jgi:hypothetical protein